MATQEEVTALEQAVDQTVSDLSTSVAAVQAELDQVVADHPSLDLSTALQKVSALDDAVKQVADLKPTVQVDPAA